MKINIIDMLNYFQKKLPTNLQEKTKERKKIYKMYKKFGTELGEKWTEAVIEASLNKKSPGPVSTQEKLLQISGKEVFDWVVQ
jgi:hypothetical protein